MFRPNTPAPAPFPWPWLIGLLAAALAVRVGFVLSLPVDEAAMARSLPDQREYLDLGRNLLAGDGLRFVDPRFSDEVRAFRTPGYPVLVAACGGNVAVVRVVQAAIDTSTVLATFLLAWRWLSPRLSLLAAAGVAANPFLVYFCSLILTETLFASLVAWSMALLARTGSGGGGRANRAGGRRAAFWIGVSLACCAIYVRPSAAGLPLVLGAAAVLAGGSTQVLRLKGFTLPVGAAMLALTVTALAPWAVRNRTVTGAWVWTSTNDGFTLYDGLNPDADGSSDQSFVRRMPVLQTMNEVARSRYLSRQALAWAGENPRRAVELAGRKLARMWSPVPLSAEFGGRRAYVGVAAAYAVPLFVLTMIGLWAGPLPRSAKVLLVLPAVYFSVGHAITVGSLRYRVPAEPMLCVVAASAFAGASRPRPRLPAPPDDARAA